ncbi:MAG: NAD(P)H-dependent oxidoreductase [Thermodesulfobacteriota bacterium]
MLILGLQGSPRQKGNTAYLLATFLDECRIQGATTKIIPVAKKDIRACLGCGFCETHGYCVIIDDAMSREIYTLLREAEVIVAASPIFFYNFPSGIKALIDRSQTLWSRKYKFGLDDPRRGTRKGFLLAQGATRGKDLFQGTRMTAKYFFDAVGAEFAGSLTYRRIEAKGDMEKHPTVILDCRQAVRELLPPLQDRKTIIFACRENSCRSQMAAAFAGYLAGDRFEVLSAGSEPAAEINPDTVRVMQEKGLDLAFFRPRPLPEALESASVDLIVTMGCGEVCPVVPGARRLDWDLPDPAGRSIEFMRETRDRIEEMVRELVSAETSA